MNSSIFLVKDQPLFRYNKQLKHYLIVGFIELMFVIYKLTHYVAFFFVATIFLFTFVLLVNEDDFPFIVFAFLPSTLLMKYTNSGSALLGYCILLAELKFLFLKKKIFQINHILPILLLSISIIFTVLLNDSISFLFRYFRFFVSIIYILSLLNNESCLVNIKNNGVKYFISGVVINLILGIFFVLAQNRSLFSGNFNGVSIDRNYFSTIVSVAICFLILLLIREKSNPIRIVQLIFLVFGGLLSGSRTFFASLIVPLIAIIWTTLNRKYTVKSLSILFILLFGSLLLSGIFGPLVMTILNRFGADDVSGGNGRFEAWEFYINNTLRSPVTFLFGGGDNIELYVGSNGFLTVQHNTFVEAISEIGFLGSILLIIVFVLMFMEMNVSGKKDVVSLFPFASLILCYFFINGLFGDTMSFVIFLCFVFYKYQSFNNANYRNRCKYETSSN